MEAKVNYWLDLFTGTTYEQFRKAGANVSGFRHRMRNSVSKIRPGDILLCYLTGVMRWVGALEVIGPSDDKSVIWDYDFPVRLKVKPVIMLDPQNGVPMEDLEGRVLFYSGPKDRGKFKGFVRGSPNLFKKPGDGEIVIEMLRQAQSKPLSRPVDPLKLARKPLFKAQTRKGKKSVDIFVTVPDREETTGAKANGLAAEEAVVATTQHSEIQYLLAELGGQMGFDIWVARNDRGKSYSGKAFSGMSRMLAQLPTLFNEAADKTVEMIDVLWLKGNSVVAGIEIECTTSVYSGLLRMSDLLALQPTLNIKLYVVAPDDRRSKVEQEILRPTFRIREKPLSEVCGFLAISELSAKIEAVRKLGLIQSLKPDFLEQMAVHFTSEK
jgi:hypothetical protein